MAKVGLDPKAMADSKNWRAESGMKFNLENDQALNLPKNLGRMTLGLGWDTRVDLDASILMLDKSGKLVDKVFYDQLVSKDFALLHNGDNETGEGDGDDETIEIYMSKINQAVDSVWLVITIYTDGFQFDDVKGAYCRLMSDGFEFCRYNLSKNRDGVSNGSIMASLKR